MRVTDIMVWRDGGLFRDEKALPRGGSDERVLVVELRAWLEASMTNDIVKGLKRLDSVSPWRISPVSSLR
jgi:hypothetical protein